MEIKYKDFVLQPGSGRYTFDLIQKVPVVVTAVLQSKGHFKDKKVGDVSGTVKDKLVGYDFSLERAIRVMIELTLAEKKGTISLSEWLAAYIKEKEEILHEVRSAVSVEV